MSRDTTCLRVAKEWSTQRQNLGPLGDRVEISRLESPIGGKNNIEDTLCTARTSDSKVNLLNLGNESFLANEFSSEYELEYELE